MSRLFSSSVPVVAAALSVLTAFPAKPAPAEENAAPSVAEAIADEVRQLFQKCRKAVVKIEATDRHGRLSGSGFFIDPNGILYTSYTIGGESRDMVVCTESAKFPARRLVADARSGVAILKVDSTSPSFLTIGRSSDLAVASPVVTIGYPMGLPASPSFGTIGGFDLRYLTRVFATTHIRANVPVQRGEGGAPLLNMRGEVIGLTIASVDSGSARFVLPIEAAEKVRKDYLRFGEVRPGWIGIAVAPAEKPMAGSQVLIESLIEDTPASRSGIEVGDVLLQIGDRKISRPEDVIDASFFITAEDEVTVKVARAAVGELEFTMEAAEHPAIQRSSGKDLHPILPVFGDSEIRTDMPGKNR